MRFVHIIEINDPLHSLLEPMTRDQLWRGLLRRVERPMEFLPQLSGCLIVMRSDTNIVRELDFGAFLVRDRVRLDPMNQLSVETEARDRLPSGKLVIAIEEPGAERMQLRFTYDVERERSDDVEAEKQYDRVLEAAYLQADIDSVKRIRQLIDADSL
jgi:hypothetical protein